MLPAASVRAGGSRERTSSGPAPPENTRDIIMIYEEDAEEWALYLTEVFFHVVKREAVLLYRLENYSFSDLELLNLNSYKCKLLILSNGLLKDLTPKKCQFLEKVLHSPESVVTLLCGVTSSDQLYKLLNVAGGKWEMSTEQEPQDYIAVIESIIFRDSEDYLEVNILTNLEVEHLGEISKRKEIEELSKASRDTIPLAMVLPAEIPCENPGEIFIILRDEVIGDTVEVEFTTNSKRIRTQPTRWNKTIWCMKALDFPAGTVSVRIYCDGVIKATTEMKYSTTAKPKENLLGVAHPGNSVCQKDIDELDDILTSIFKREIPYYEFRSSQPEINPQKEHTHFKELPTLLHCAAKFGLKNLAVHLLQCSGATWASKMKNFSGSDPAHIAERHGHKELKKIFEDFSIPEVSRNDEQENDYEDDITSLLISSPTAQKSAFGQASGQTSYRLRAEGAEAGELAKEEKENASGPEAEQSPAEAGSGSSVNEYDEDLYVFIPGDSPEQNSAEALMSSRPPLPPPRPVPADSQLEKPHGTLQAGKMVGGQMERSQNWCDLGARQETGGEPKELKKEDEKEQEKEEDPYTIVEIEDSDYDMILANMSTKKKVGSRSFIINRPPAPTPRPTNIPPKEETTPYIAQVFQQKTARRQSDGDKFHGPKRQDRARMESQAFSTVDCLAAGQEELILLQEKVKNGKLSVDEALEKFKHWQMGKTELEMIQQEKLRQLRDCIIGKRPEEENVSDKLTIVHYPNGNENARNENMLYNIPFHNKLPTRLQVEKEFGFCCKRDY
ncbi:B-cell scaffold protein with ankyrin repeats isoform X1 [Lutra lutra]|uniref:B-cell scaffold protein with ankyrin repeats isoform X1 n=1 Tax=Lutra lutra TaxID=9657 RepID=UPI001FD320E7|nr:B-cell scaffold protein with ankyrin repeats isoform X1 [Lutra lutra]